MAGWQPLECLRRAAVSSARSLRPLTAHGQVISLLRAPRTSFDYDLFYLNVLRPMGRVCRPAAPHEQVPSGFL